MKITAFTPETEWTDAAGLPGVPGLTVAIAMVAFYVVLLALVRWPGDHLAMDEIRGTESGAWRTRERNPVSTHGWRDLGCRQHERR